MMDYTYKIEGVNIADSYYLVGGPNDWKQSAVDKVMKFSHSDKSVVDDPVFTVTFPAAAAGDTWVAFGDDEACEAVADTTGTAFCVAFVEATVSLTATATENGLTRRLEASHVLKNLIDVLGELLVLHEVVGSSTSSLGLSSEELEHAASLRSVRLALTTGLATTTRLLAGLLGLFLLLLFLLFFLLLVHRHLSGQVRAFRRVEDNFVNDHFVHGGPERKGKSDEDGTTSDGGHLLVGFRHKSRN
jgi:hypothetical protein